jgi:hypothetical protein
MATVRLRSSETVEEVDWLLGGGMSPVQICEAMSSTPGAIAKAAWRVGRSDLFTMFEQVKNWERRLHRERG